MFKKIALPVLAILFASSTPTWPQAWQTLTNVPILTRYNDVYFVNPDRGWIVNGSGQIYRTTTGGAAWEKQLDQAVSHFRSIGFVDSLHGWAGNVGAGEFGATDSTALYHTADGGATWAPVKEFSGPTPRGLCGMHVVNDSVICAVGRVRGPAFFVRTTDRGKTWTSMDMSAYAAGLIDVYFFHPDTGIAVGLTNSTHDRSRGIVLYTTNGGKSWEKRLTTARTGEWCWKISFPSRTTGYVSLQRNSQSPIYILKTTDGGVNWRDKLFSSGYYFVQGIGFVDEQHGWIGGNSTNPNYQTADGGETWQPAGFGVRMNRMRFLSDTLGYAVGQTVYKYTARATAVATPAPKPPAAYALRQNYPNPFNPKTTIRFHLPARSQTSIVVYDLMGREIEQLLRQSCEAGEHEVSWDGKDREGNPVSSGVYLYTIRAGDFSATRKMILLK